MGWGEEKPPKVQTPHPTKTFVPGSRIGFPMWIAERDPLVSSYKSTLKGVLQHLCNVYGPNESGDIFIAESLY
eukprot:3565986-Rhodomonas_salina.1